MGSSSLWEKNSLDDEILDEDLTIALTESLNSISKTIFYLNLLKTK